MFRIILIITLNCLIFNSNAQKQFSFDSTYLVGKEKQIYNYRHIAIDKNDNKFILGFFKGNLNVDTFSINTSSAITNSTSPSAQGGFLAKI
jgi:hypothetical protein